MIASRSARPPYPRLQWDRRPFVPLTMSPSEAWPQNRMSLILSEPIPRDQSRDIDWLEWVQDFIFGLYAQPHTAITEGLDKMQHGLSNIMKDCPALTDPKRGGRLQMHHLRVRMLTPEQIEELVTVYRKWPFKAPGSDHNKLFSHQGISTRDGLQNPTDLGKGYILHFLNYLKEASSQSFWSAFCFNN